ncbi:MAG: TerD family protein, partial [bacterium]
MSISLKKGQKISLSKDTNGNNNDLTSITVGLGWEPNIQKKGLFKKATSNFDCDASAIILRNDILKSVDDVIYYSNLKHSSGAIVHSGDNLTGAGDGDDEQINVNLNALPDEFNKIVFVVNIYNCEERKQHFGLINDAFIRIFNTKTGVELCKFELTEDYTDMTCLIAGEIYKNNDEWKFNSVGQATKDVKLA